MARQWGTFSTIGRERLASIVAEAESIPDVLRELGLTNQTNSRKAFWEAVNTLNIDAERLRLKMHGKPPRTAEHTMKLRATKLGVSLDEVRRMGLENLRWCRFHKGAVQANQFKSERQRDCNACLKASWLHQGWGLSMKWFLSKLKEQGGACAVCRKETPVDALVVDHNHSHCEKGCAECARGLLCERCNIALGWLEILKRTPEILGNAEKYLEKYGWG